MDLYNILEKVSVLNRDNGKRFTRTDRLDAITTLLWNSKYRRINNDGLFHLYAAKPPEEQQGPVYVISSHVDCQEYITRCFTKIQDDGLLCGTYDNAITNAAVLFAMLSDSLPDNVWVCFTGDEECNSKGAEELADYIKMKGIRARCVVVLDVTDMGWNEKADFTVENNFWDYALGRRVISFIQKSNPNWRFVPSDPNDIPDYVDKAHIIRLEAEEDESWEYDEMRIQCFSFCIPVCGEMHSNAGVLVRQSSFETYIRMLSEMMRELCRMIFI